MKKRRDNKPPESPGSDRERNDALNKKERGEGKLPGEYPPKEDIMNRQNMQRVGLDVENFARGVGIENFNRPGEPVVTDRNAVFDEPDLSTVDSQQPQKREPIERPVPKDLNLEEENSDLGRPNESDVTQEDLQALGPEDLSMDMGEDEALKNRVWPVDMAAEDLDVPGVPDDNNSMNQAIAPEDEENDFYSLGGDRHEDNLEGK